MTGFFEKTKLTELENKIPDVSSLATKTALTAVENKIPSASSLLKKTDYDKKTNELEKKLTDHNHGKYITIPEFNTLAADVFNARLTPANLVTKTDFDTKLSSLNRKITSNKTNHLLVENELKELKKFSEKSVLGIFSIFITTSRFDGGDGFQAYLIFQPVHRDIKLITNTKYISEWKSKGLSDEIIKPSIPSDNNLAPLIDSYGYKIRVKFNGNILRQPKVSYTHEKPVNIYIVYLLAGFSSHSADATLKKCLFGAVTLTKNADIYKYGYSGYGIGFDRKSSFSFPGSGFGQNVLIFGADMSSSAYIDNKKKIY